MVAKSKIEEFTTDWTYGCEHEWADWHHDTLPQDYVRNKKNYSVVNSNGIANDPTGKYYQYGGEINTIPHRSINDQLEQVDVLCRVLDPQPTVNYRSNLHIHVGIPGLAKDLPLLKKIQRAIHDHLPHLLKWKIEPMPEWRFGDADSQIGMRRRLKRMKQSHQTFLTPDRLYNQLTAKNLKQFFEREVPKDHKGKVMWHAQPRVAVNLRQLRETETIEFRHFPGTLTPMELRTAFDWCRDFLYCVINSENPGLHYELNYANKTTRRFPSFEPYQHELEVKYRLTCHDGSLNKEEIRRNINDILRDEPK